MAKSDLGMVTVTYSAVTRTITVSRVPFNARAYYNDGTLPGNKKFCLVSPCCCWRCRSFELFGPPGSVNSLSSDDFIFPWTKTETTTDPDDDDPEDTSGELPATVTFLHSLDFTRAAFCENADEDEREGTPIALGTGGGDVGIFSVYPGFHKPPMDWVYTDSLGHNVNGTGYTDAITLPGPAGLDAPLVDFCGDGASFNSSITFNGTSGDEEGIIYSVTNLKIAASFALT